MNGTRKGLCMKKISVISLKIAIPLLLLLSLWGCRTPEVIGEYEQNITRVLSEDVVIGE